MSDDCITQAEVIVLVDERIKLHDEAINEPKHNETRNLIKALTTKLDILVIGMTKIETTANLVMKFAMGGLVVWCVRQVVELIKSFHP